MERKREMEIKIRINAEMKEEGEKRRGERRNTPKIRKSGMGWVVEGESEEKREVEEEERA